MFSFTCAIAIILPSYSLLISATNHDLMDNHLLRFIYLRLVYLQFIKRSFTGNVKCWCQFHPDCAQFWRKKIKMGCTYKKSISRVFMKRPSSLGIVVVAGKLMHLNDWPSMAWLNKWRQRYSVSWYVISANDTKVCLGWITDPVCGESTSHWWFPVTAGG